MFRACGSCAHFARVRLTRVCVFGKRLVPCAVLTCARFGSCGLLVRVRLGCVCFGPYTFFVSCAFGSCVCRDRGSCAVLIHGAFFSCKFGSRAVFLLCSFFVCAYIWLVCV